MSCVAVIGLVGKSMFFDVPRFHRGGETIAARSYYEEWGGKGFNQAVAAARQGAKVSFLGKVGNETDSRAVAAFCAGEVIPAPPTKAVDTTGAGDTFSAVFAVRLAEGEALRDACIAANAAAAEEVTMRYVMPSIPRRHWSAGNVL